MTTKPNIILFITHDQGQFLGCYNTPATPNSLQTPNLDKLAKDGFLFFLSSNVNLFFKVVYIYNIQLIQENYFFQLSNRYAFSNF